MINSQLEMGGNLSEFDKLVKFASLWFVERNVPIPTGAKAWQKCSVRRGEVPPGTNVGALRRLNINVSDFIEAITGISRRKYTDNPITANSIEELGYTWLDYRWVNGHKRVSTKCNKCTHEEELDYGTLQRMKVSGNKFCRYCRNAGGKEKNLETYNIFDGFTILGRSEDGRFLYKCAKCSSTIERTMTHVNQAEYFVCEHCNPRENFGARLYTDLGYFDSKLEFEAYKILLKFIDPENIVRQKKYDELFGTRTNHKADFYLVDYDIVLEVTSKYNKIGDNYKETAKWKKSLSPKVIFAYSLKEVEDIVRPLVKTKGQAVGYC